MRRKILMGVLALALPAGTVLATSSAAVAKKGPPNPVTCTGFSGLVTFGTGINTAGTDTTSKKALPTTVGTSHFSCSGGTAPNTGGSGETTSTLTIKGGVNDANPSYSKTACKANPGNTTDCDKYVTGSWNEFVASGSTISSDLKKISFSIAGQAAQMKVTGSHEIVGGACGGDVGFQLTGSVKSNDYGDASGTVLACLGSDSGPGTTGNFGADFERPGATVTSAEIDPTVSTASI